ncbi:MAG TPA: glycosyltransferase family 4 protein [Ignavibacteria bacterium]|nr:glycosyltransferase family 4 protein [Ignavibacteria bacterium]HRF65610.1 glycosyltransferase family 4 protein [Ignavibacteria bacterium]HRJ03358.1 glycosyltransferase family 4 protein [Ignavibacteria bacterium]
MRNIKTLNILLLNALDIYGGGEFFVYQLAKLLTQKGHKVWVSCRKDNIIYSKCIEEGIGVFPVDYPEHSGKSDLWKNSRILGKFIKENKIDIVHSNTNYDRTAGAFAAKFAGVKHVSNVHSFHSISHNLTHWYRNKFLIHHFMVDGVCTKDLLINEDKIDPAKITLLHLGLDPELNKKDPETGKLIRKEFGVKDEEILIGNVARMVPFKGQEYLIRAYPDVLKAFPESKLMIVGDGELSDMLHKLAEELGVSERTIFPGFRSDIKSMYSAFDIYAHTSVEGGGETFPYAMLHALAQELPMVITRVGDMPAMVEDGVNGFVLNDKDVKSISEKLMLLCGDKKLRFEMGKKSFELMLRKFTVDIMAANIEKVYSKILS